MGLWEEQVEKAEKALAKIQEMRPAFDVAHEAARMIPEGMYASVAFHGSRVGIHVGCVYSFRALQPMRDWLVSEGYVETRQNKLDTFISFDHGRSICVFASPPVGEDNPAQCRAVPVGEKYVEGYIEKKYVIVCDEEMQG